MTPIEIFALIVVAIAFIKIVVMLIKAKAWMAVVKAVYAIPVLTAVISLIVGAVILYYLLMVEQLTIVQIFGVILFMMPLLALSFAMSGKETTQFATKALKGKILRKYWLPLIIWLALMVWVVIELFF